MSTIDFGTKSLDNPFVDQADNKPKAFMGASELQSGINKTLTGESNSETTHDAIQAIVTDRLGKLDDSDFSKVDVDNALEDHANYFDKKPINFSKRAGQVWSEIITKVSSDYQGATNKSNSFLRKEEGGEEVLKQMFGLLASTSTGKELKATQASIGTFFGKIARENIESSELEAPVRSAIIKLMSSSSEADAFNAMVTIAQKQGLKEVASETNNTDFYTEIRESFGGGKMGDLVSQFVHMRAKTLLTKNLSPDLAKKVGSDARAKHAKLKLNLVKHVKAEFAEEHDALLETLNDEYGLSKPEVRKTVDDLQNSLYGVFLAKDDKAAQKKLGAVIKSFQHFENKASELQKDVDEAKLQMSLLESTLNASSETPAIISSKYLNEDKLTVMVSEYLKGTALTPEQVDAKKAEVSVTDAEVFDYIKDNNSGDDTVTVQLPSGTVDLSKANYGILINAKKSDNTFAATTTWAEGSAPVTLKGDQVDSPKALFDAIKKQIVDSKKEEITVENTAKTENQQKIAELVDVADDGSVSFKTSIDIDGVSTDLSDINSLKAVLADRGLDEWHFIYDPESDSDKSKVQKEALDQAISNAEQVEEEQSDNIQNHKEATSEILTTLLAPIMKLSPNIATTVAQTLVGSSIKDGRFKPKSTKEGFKAQEEQIIEIAKKEKKSLETKLDLLKTRRDVKAEELSKQYDASEAGINLGADALATAKSLKLAVGSNGEGNSIAYQTVKNVVDAIKKKDANFGFDPDSVKNILEGKTEDGKEAKTSYQKAIVNHERQKAFAELLIAAKDSNIKDTDVPNTAKSLFDAVNSGGKYESIGKDQLDALDDLSERMQSFDTAIDDMSDELKKIGHKNIKKLSDLKEDSGSEIVRGALSALRDNVQKTVKLLLGALTGKNETFNEGFNKTLDEVDPESIKQNSLDGMIYNAFQMVKS